MFTVLFSRAINWDVVNDNVDALAAVLLPNDDDSDDDSEIIPLF